MASTTALQRELARLRTLNTSPRRGVVKRRNRREEVNAPPPSPTDAGRVVTTADDVTHQVVALREEVQSLRALLSRVFRTGSNGLSTF